MDSLQVARGDTPVAFHAGFDFDRGAVARIAGENAIVERAGAADQQQEQAETGTHRLLAMFPAVNARILNSEMRNSGSATLVSTTPNTTSSAIPPKMAVSTHGLVQPMGWPP